MYVVPLYDFLALPDVNLYVRVNEFEAQALQAPTLGGEVILLMAKKRKARNEYLAEDFFEIGIHGIITDISEDHFVTVHTDQRVQASEVAIDAEGMITLTAETLETLIDITEDERMVRLQAIKGFLSDFAEHFDWAEKMLPLIEGFQSIEEAAVTLSPWMNTRIEDRYRMLTYDHTRGRVEALEQMFYEFVDIAKAGMEAMSQQKVEYENNMREQSIRRQIDILQHELDEMHPENATGLEQFAKKIEDLPMNDFAKAEARKVLRRLNQENSSGNEYALLYDYLEYLLALPWEKAESQEIDVAAAEAILNEDHYGLDKVKRRVIQQLAVMALKKRQAGSILLFAGPPGTGKTSVGQSIARALGRKYVRVSLGGVRDEADIRGHRRTYIGAMAGRIIDGIHKVGVSNPVMVLDEVDKLTASYNGDPASALLEVLDPEQNSEFVDHYLNVPYDLSDVFFVCTANRTDSIPSPLLNRMEVIPFSGYTALEKMGIAKAHLLEKAYDYNGIKSEDLIIPDDTLEAVIADYTMEAGVRGLRKRIDALCRYAAVKLTKGEQPPFTVQVEDLPEWIDKKPILHDRVLKEKKPGVVTGLAWTQAGGDILYIEALFTRGNGKLFLTGKLGEVMKESAYLALNLVKSLYPDKAKFFRETDLHIHVPDGAVPKDGPSAGITLTTAIASFIHNQGVAPHIAMTGEVSLRGAVTAIGGLKEKLMAAERAGITTVLIPAENVRDLEDVDDAIKEKLQIIPVETIEEVLEQVGLRTEDEMAEAAEIMQKEVEKALEGGCCKGSCPKGKNDNNCPKE